MSDIKQELDKIRGRISEPSFLKKRRLEQRGWHSCVLL